MAGSEDHRTGGLGILPLEDAALVRLGGYRLHHLLGKELTAGGVESPLMDKAKSAFAVTPEKQRVFGWIDYAAATWDRERRIIAKGGTVGIGPAEPIYGLRCG